MSNFEQADVVICGAGIAGIATAYFLAQQGVTDVVIIDRHPPLSQTSAKSGENYRNWWPDKPMVQFMNRSIEIMQQLASATDNVFNMTRRGYLYVTRQPMQSLCDYLDHYGQLEIGSIRVHDETAANGCASPSSSAYAAAFEGADILAGHEVVRQAFPHLSSDIHTAIHARRAGDFSVQQLGSYLLGEAKKQSVRLVSGEVIAALADGQGVRAIEAVIEGRQQTIGTRCFVNAAGPFAPAVASLLEVELPVASILQQKIAFQDLLGVIPRDAPFTIVMDRQHLEWDEDERLSLQSDPEVQWLLQEFPGGLHIKPEGGPNGNWIKLGWAINDVAEQPRCQTSIAPEFTELVVRGAARFVPGLRQYVDRMPKPVVQYAGYYTKTPENLPLIGPMGVPGAYIVGALSGFGTMAGCAAGELAATWVLGGRLPDYAHTLSLARYDLLAEGEGSVPHARFDGEL